MKKLLNISLLAALLLTSACSKDEMFGSFGAGETGQLSFKKMLVELKNEEKVIKKTRADVNVNDFNIDIIPSGQTEALESYTYAELPEVVTLPVGSYTVRASYGDNLEAAFEAPYFKGEAEYEIKANEINDAVGTIVCKFSNIKVTVDFDDQLTARMKNAVVTVNVGDNGSLTFTKEDEGRAGYFAFVEGSTTLAAEFDGIVDGGQTNETKLFDNVAPGSHYMLHFALRTIDEDDFGDLSGDLKIETTVEVTDLNFDTDYTEEYVAVDDRYTDIEGGQKDPVNPDQPGASAPVVTAVTSGLAMNTPFDITDFAGDVTFNIKSETGLQELIVVIDSTTLTPEELDGVGLPATLNLVDPGDAVLAEKLTNFGFPVGDKVLNQTDVDFTIGNTFVGLLTMLGPGEHKFHITVKDANGTAKSVLYLKNN